MPSIIPLIMARIIKIKNKNTNHPKAIDTHSQINMFYSFLSTKKALRFL
jgi:hypothetical protein